MADAGRWVRQMIMASTWKPMTPEAIQERLEKYAGRGPLGVGRSQAALAYIEKQLLDRRGGASMRALWHAVVAYLEDTQELLAAAREAHYRDARINCADAAPR